MVRILFIAHSFPGKGSGGSFKVASTIDTLASLAKVDVIGVFDPQLSEQDGDFEFNPQQVQLQFFEQSLRSKWWHWQTWKHIAGSFFSELPYRLYKYDSPQLRQAVMTALGTTDYDVVITDALPPLRYLKQQSVPVWYLEYNIESELSEQLLQQSRSVIERYMWKLEVIKTLRSEQKLLDKVTILALSQRDQRLLKKLVPTSRVVVLPTAVPLAKNQWQSKNTTVLFTGLLNWFPNQRGLTWFLQEVWPVIKKEVPQTKLLVVGKNPSQKLLKLLTTAAGCHYLGYQADLVDIYKDVAVAIAPLPAGSGLRMKILHYWSYGLPVVATAAASQGLSSKAPLVIAQSDDYATQVIALLRDDQRSKQLSQASQSYLKQHFNRRQSQAVLKTALHQLHAKPKS